MIVHGVVANFLLQDAIPFKLWYYNFIISVCITLVPIYNHELLASGGGGEEKFNQIYHARAYSPFMRIK